MGDRSIVTTWNLVCLRITPFPALREGSDLCSLSSCCFAFLISVSTSDLVRTWEFEWIWFVGRKGVSFFIGNGCIVCLVWRRWRISLFDDHTCFLELSKRIIVDVLLSGAPDCALLSTRNMMSKSSFFFFRMCSFYTRGTMMIAASFIVFMCVFLFIRAICSIIFWPYPFINELVSLKFVLWNVKMN